MGKTSTRSADHHPVVAASLLAAAAALTVAGMARGQNAPTPAAATAPAAAVSQPAAAQATPVIGVGRFDVVFQVSSMSGEQKETTSLHLVGKPPKGLQPADDGYLLTAADVENHVLTLGIVDGTFVAPEFAKQTVHVRLKDLSYAAPAPYRASAITSIRGQITQYLNGLGLIAVLPQPSPDQLEQVGDPAAPGYRDVREAGNKDLKLIVQLGVVTSVRTIASGDRVPLDRRLDASEHDKIRYDSPVWPAESSGQQERKDVLRKDLLDEYVFRLNRHPGRRVDVAVSQADVPGGIVLDYLVSEAKPWTVYAQVSNTGTKQTNEWRERVGFIDNQLTGHDDILSLDYITSGFDGSSNAAVGSYEAPIPGLERLRGRAYGSYSDFVASDVGQGQGSADRFNGNQTTVGGELIANVWQHRDWFGDVFGGLRYEHIHTVNQTVNTEGSADVLLPYVGARVDRVTDTTSFGTSATVSYGSVDSENMATALVPDPLDVLGRPDVDDSFMLLEVSANYSFYLEPLLFPTLFREHPEQAKLANEMAFSARGQTAFGARLIPQQEEVAGGLYSVRGYPESVVAGDDVVIGSAEYRWHLPRALDLQPTPAQVFGHPFRVAPDRPLGRPDWDLIFKGFVDAGQTINNDRLSFEHDETLVGTGLGVELQLKQNINLQAYWGVALTDVAGEVDAGDNRFHFVFTVLY